MPTDITVNKAMKILFQQYADNKSMYNSYVEYVTNTSKL